MIRTAAIALLLAATVSCRSRPSLSQPPAPRNAPEGMIERLSDLEDTREIDEPFFRSAAGSELDAIRTRTAVALGRIMKPEGVATLIQLASDHAPQVRRSALFAMGQLGLRPEGLEAGVAASLVQGVLSALKDPDEGIRALAVEAAGKLALENAPGLAAPLLKDPSAAVRRQAASACFRWRQVLRLRNPEAKLTDLPPAALEALSACAGDPDAEVRWRAIHALLRGGAKPAVNTVTRFIEDSEPLARLFALNVVERHKLAELAEFTARAQADPEAFVRQAGLRALDALERPDLLLKKLVSDPSHHVREAVADVLAAEGPELEALAKDPSTAVRAAALLARVRILNEKSIEILEKAQGYADPLIRIAAVKGAGHLKAHGLPLVLKARGDADESVRAAALVLLAESEDPKAWLSIRQGLGAPGLAERGSAVEAATKRKEPDLLPAMIDCFRLSSEREWVELRESIVDLFAAGPPEKTTPFLLEVATGDAAPSVRQKAVAVLRRRNVKDVPAVAAAPSPRTPHYHHRYSYNPTVVMETTKGTIEIECYGIEAPVHVANFIGLVGQGFYDGLPWHRVVPNFVIQGGDPKGNGWGDPGWSLRAEINPMPFARGAVGMPRSAGFDTGGCQVFITHLPTAHLDGLYTVFGRVAKGLDVVDRIEVGDKVVRATVRR